MPAAIPIAIGASSALGFFGARSAAKSQEKAADKSLGLQRDIYNTSRGDQLPYIQGGYGALDALSASLGRPQTTPPPMGNGSTAVQTGPMQRFPVAGSAANASGLSAMSRGNAAGMVTLQAPDGSTRSVPQEQAAHYVQLGARRIS